MPIPTWVELHAAMTHFPVAFLMGGVIFELGALFFGKKIWREVSFWMLVGAVVMSVPSLVTGWVAGYKYTAGGANPPTVFVLHRLAGFAVSGFSLVLLLWRARSRDNFSGIARSMALTMSMVTAGIVAYTGHMGGEMVFGGRNDAPIISFPTPTNVATAPTPPAADTPKLDPKLILAGQKLFASEDNNCAGCHKINGKGGKAGPDLTHAGKLHGDINWQIEHLKNPEKLVPGSTMPAYDNLKPEELKALAVYMVSLK